MSCRVTGLTVAALMLLVGCSSVRLGYGHGTTLAYWWLDGYIDISRTQAPQVRGAIEQWFTWHRSQRLPADLALLERARREAAGELTAARVCAWRQPLQQWADQAATQLGPAVAAFVPTLAPAQIVHLEQQFDERNRDWARKHLQPDAQDRLDELLDRVVENAERLYGRLSREQRGWLRERLAQTVWQPEAAQAERLTRQRLILQTLRQQAGAPWTAQEAQQWLLGLLEPVDAAARQQRELFYAERCQLVADLHQRVTSEQRRHAVKVLAGWQDDLRTFRVDPAAASASAALWRLLSEQG